MKQRRAHRFSVYLKISCSALLVSGSLIGYGFTHNTHADSTDATNTIKQTQDDTLSNLNKRVEEAKNDISQLNDLSNNDIKDFQSRIDKAKDNSKINDILDEAKQRNEDIANSVRKTEDKNSSAIDNNSNDTKDKINNDIKDMNSNDSKNIEELNKLLDDKNFISNNVDNHQQNNSTNNSQQDDALKKLHDDNKNLNNNSLFKRLDSIKNDVDSNDSKSNSTASQDNASSRQDDNKLATTQSKLKDRQDALDKDINNLKTQADNNSSNVDDKVGKITKDLQGSDQITHALAERQSQQVNDNKDYLNQKLDELNALDKKVKEDKNLAEANKQEITNDIDQAHQKLNDQQNVILDQLKNDKDKVQATKNILNSIMSQNEAQDALKKIQTKGQSDKAIANQIAQQIDGLATTSSDDILKSMLEQSKDREKLIKELLSTRLGDNEASNIAKKLANSNLSPSQIVDQLKRNFNQNGNATANDILNGVLNNAKNKKEAIETILATRLNQDKAKLLANVIARAQNDKADALQLIHSALNGKANDLLQLENRAKQAKSNVNSILSPITNQPSLLDRIQGLSSHSPLASLLNQLASLTGGSSLLDGLNSNGSSLLDGLNGLKSSTPENGLSLGSGDGLLSGLFNDDGNISLPATGKALKESAVPLAIIALAVGGTLIWVSRRKKHHAQ